MSLQRFGFVLQIVTPSWLHAMTCHHMASLLTTSPNHFGPWGTSVSDSKRSCKPVTRFCRPVHHHWIKNLDAEKNETSEIQTVISWNNCFDQVTVLQHDCKQVPHSKCSTVEQTFNLKGHRTWCLTKFSSLSLLHDTCWSYDARLTPPCKQRSTSHARHSVRKSGKWYKPSRKELNAVNPHM